MKQQLLFLQCYWKIQRVTCTCTAICWNFSAIEQQGMNCEAWLRLWHEHVFLAWTHLWTKISLNLWSVITCLGELLKITKIKVNYCNTTQSFKFRYLPHHSSQDSNHTYFYSSFTQTTELSYSGILHCIIKEDEQNITRGQEIKWTILFIRHFHIYCTSKETYCKIKNILGVNETNDQHEVKVVLYCRVPNDDSRIRVLAHDHAVSFWLMPLSFADYRGCPTSTLLS